MFEVSNYVCCCCCCGRPLKYDDDDGGGRPSIQAGCHHHITALWLSFVVRRRWCRPLLTRIIPINYVYKCIIKASREDTCSNTRKHECRVTTAAAANDDAVTTISWVHETYWWLLTSDETHSTITSEYYELFIADVAFVSWFWCWWCKHN